MEKRKEMRYLRKFNESGNMSEYISDVGHIQFDYNFLDVGVLKGKIIEDIVINREKTEIILSVEGSGFYEFYKFYHQKDCCESVWIEDIEGDLNDLLGHPILQAEKITEKKKNNSYESSTWTFYKLATIKGYVTIRWVGISNGYYSEEVDLVKSVEVATSYDEMFKMMYGKL